MCFVMAGLRSIVNPSAVVPGLVPGIHARYDKSELT
jgi:hypothetical protein